jgi:surface antigen
MHSASLRPFKLAILLLATVGTLAMVCLVVAPRAQAEARLINPYSGDYGPPNCTWYAWQRLHDTQHIDLQFSAKAGDWIEYARQPNAAWNEDISAFVVPEVNTLPAAGDILVLPVKSRYANPYHVAYVEEVYSNGRFLVSQQSFGDYSPGTNTSPYPYVRHGTWQLDDVQHAEQNGARFLHFPRAAAATQALEDDATVVRADSSVSSGIDQQIDVAVTLENTGETTWDDAQGYLLLCSSPDCLGVATIDLDGQSVQPGQQHTFVAHLTAPHNLATVNTTWTMEHNGIVFGPSVPIQIVVGPSTDDQAELVTQEVPSSVQAGQRFSAVFVIRNAGRSTWSSQVGYGLACVSMCLGSQGLRPVAQPVAPGDQVTFTADDVTAPQSAGLYIPVWQMTSTEGAFGPQFTAIIVVASPWTSLYEVQRPSCDDPAAWTNASHTAVSDCTRPDGFALSQSSETEWAELDLTATNVLQGYDLTRLRARTQATFLNVSDANVWATLVAHTPQFGTCSGFLFAVNATGHWQVQRISSGCAVSTIASGQTTLDPTKFTIEVIVQNGQFAAAIDNQVVAHEIADTLSPPSSLFGLMTESPHATTSAVLFSDFAIDHWS